TADRRAAAADLSACVERLKPVYRAVGQGDNVVAQNVRFRLAQALADLAEVGGEGAGAAGSRERWNAEALAALTKPVTEPSLQGYARLLRGTLLARLNRFDEARTEVAA